MEDYQAAFLECYSDTEILDKSGIKIAAMHFGGVTIECLLKAMIFATLPKSATKEWKTDNNNPGHTFTNPGHSYTEALKRHNKLKSRIDKLPQVRKWLDEIENPIGQHFIDIRYSSIEVNNENYKSWFNTYQKLRKWLQKQATTI
ncbi:hypothetical protein AFK68_02365 [Hydrocoleum sp. CS-953]|uniref:hypothetical protein n=1 Tax=Hydrocoleum sp. CS-953 TaxID=1671698 RepID=UPI000B9B815D|nr:hypothetical protein [Hydrocoleum sp. CS-953]OZH55027.1 hypothetical protein AFK68_07160 [Hydrocoleum sp. CS-953]OZH55782.1 hypothetical protein AFK68_02365 [Hydrocoleum sp. CS-953]